MPDIMAPVGQWRPDSPDLGSGDGNPTDSLEALNVVPKESTYGPFPSFAAVSNALDARVQGAFFARKSDGSGVVFAGTATKLYRLTVATFTDVSRLVGGAYSCPSDGMWDFKQFGAIVYASNGNDSMQKFNIDTDSNFTLNTGSPPIAKYMSVAGDFLWTGNQGAFRQRAQWSAINDPTASWAASQVTQASSQDLPDGGWILGMVGQEYTNYIFQEFAIRRADYSGDQFIWRFSKVSDRVGLTIPGTLASYRDLIFFYDQSGFYSLQGGSNINPIGEQRVNRYFKTNCDQTNLARVTSAIDPLNGLYIIAFPDANATSGNPNNLLCYSWTVNKWCHVQSGSSVQMIYSAATQSGFTIEQLAALYGTIENVPFPFDSAVWAGVAQLTVGGFDTSNKLGYFNGPNLQATVDTTEVNLAGNGNYSFVFSARPMVDGGTPTLQIGTRNRTEDAVTFSAASTMDARGRCHFRSSARFHRGRIIVPAASTWTHIQGIDNIIFRPEGGY